MKSNANSESFMKKNEGKESDWKEYKTLRAETQYEYQKEYIEHPEWSHQQIMAKIVIGRHY